MLKRKYKGMTLAEIMTAIAIAGLMALLMVQVMNCVNATMRSTTNLNKRLAYEGKVADNLQTTEADAMTDAELQNFNVRIRYDQQGGAYTKSVNVDNEPGVVRITEYTCKYDVSDYVGSEANYHFLVAAPHTYTPSVTPGGGFMVRLIVPLIRYRRLRSPVLRSMPAIPMMRASPEAASAADLRRHRSLQIPVTRLRCCFRQKRM